MIFIEWIGYVGAFSIFALGGGYFFGGKFKNNIPALLVGTLITIIGSYYTVRAIEDALYGVTKYNPSLEQRLYDEALYCIRTSCVFDGCFSIFTDQFPSNARIDTLRAIADGARNSLRCKPAANPCALESNYNDAISGGKNTMRAYLRQCNGFGGQYADRAKNALEATLYNEAQTCIRSTCTFGDCFAIYADDFPSGTRITSLKIEADNVANSQRCKPSLPPPCTQPALYTEAVNGGLEAIRAYVRNCRETRSVYLDQARETLETMLLNDSEACISRSCVFDACLSMYLDEFPSGKYVATIKAQVESARYSPRCNAPPPPPAPPAHCVVFNGRQICG